MTVDPRTPSAREQLQLELARGELDNIAQILKQLRSATTSTTDIARIEEAAQQWQAALAAARCGDFDLALAGLDRVAILLPWPLEQLSVSRRELENRRAEMDRLTADLQDALEQERWREVLPAADAVLAVAAGHALARRARELAWQAVQPPTHPGRWGGTADDSERGTQTKKEEMPRRLLLWIDGVGGYLVCLSPRVSLGQATPDAAVDVPLAAEISRLHAYLLRDAEGYVLEALRPVFVKGEAVERALLRDGEEFQLGTGCRLRFEQPVPLSATARLGIVGRRGLPLALDGVLLMADTLVIGPGVQAHVAVPELTREILLARWKEGLQVLAKGAFEVDGRPVHDQAAATLHGTVSGDDFRFSLEPVGPRLLPERV